MRITRRQFLRSIGAVSILITGTTVYRTVDQGVFSTGQGPAYAPWTTWHTDPAEGLLRLVQSAILAANPHNSQPWGFRVTDTRIELFADTTRNLATMDPYLREMYIGLGCALENMMLTAEAIGYAVQLTIMPGQLTGAGAQPQMVKVATLDLSPTTPNPSPLYPFIPARHTDRSSYDTERAIPAELLNTMTALAERYPETQVVVFERATPAFQTIASQTIQSTEYIIADEQMAHDSHVWFDTSWQEVQQEKDGPYIDTAGVPAHMRALVKVLPPLPEAQMHAGWLSSTQQTMQESAVLGCITVRDLYDTAQALQAGQLWQRLHLWAVSQGLGMQPVCQIPEVIDRERQLKQPERLARTMAEVLGTTEWRPTFVFRMGYPTMQVLPSARRPVAEVLV
jgi:hypothetical protein